MRDVDIAPTFEAWQIAARSLLREGVRPDEIVWHDTVGSQPPLPIAASTSTSPASPSMPGDDAAARDVTSPVARVPRRFLELARDVACHADAARWRLLYSVLWRLVHGQRDLLTVAVDPEIAALLRMRQQVREDTHRMMALVRFRRVVHAGEERYVAWYRPDHHVLRLAAPSFRERFASMRWSILTPDASAHWDGVELTYGPGAPRAVAPTEDEFEGLWRDYDAAVFHPVRANLAATRRHMPVRDRPGRPETGAIPGLLRDVAPRLAAVVASPTQDARAFVPAGAGLAELASAASRCQGCDLYRHASQTVFGRGPVDARVVLVGEQPGDAEDRQGLPFVGPAGEVLDRALGEAGLDRAQLWITNAVKHFKFVERGKRRIHQTPLASEVTACRPWLEAELAVLEPETLVCLGATAARALLGADFRLMRDRGRFLRTRWAPRTIATLHPSAVLRGEDTGTQARLYAMLVADLKQIATPGG